MSSVTFEFYYIAKDELELLILQHLPPKRGDYRHRAVYLVYAVLGGIELRVLCMLGKHHTNLAVPMVP